MLVIREIISDIVNEFRNEFCFLGERKGEVYIFKDTLVPVDYKNDVEKIANEIVDLYMNLLEFPITIENLPEPEKKQLLWLEEMVKEYPLKTEVCYFVDQGLCFFKLLEISRYGYTNEQFEEMKQLMDEEQRNQIELRVIFGESKNKMFISMIESIYEKYNFYAKQININELGQKMDTSLNEIATETIRKALNKK